MIKDNQTEYYKALKSSDKTADSTLFIEFMLSLLLRTMEEIIENEKKVTVNQNKIINFRMNRFYVPPVRQPMLKYKKNVKPKLIYPNGKL